MKMFDINGKTVTVDVSATSYPLRQKSRSDIQNKVGTIIQEVLPHDTILEEFTVPGSRLSVDFFLPQRKLAIEVDGNHHYEYSPFFHGHRGKHLFAKQKINDSEKEQWAEMNNITLVRIKENYTSDIIKKTIKDCIDYKAHPKLA